MSHFLKENPITDRGATALPPFAVLYSFLFEFSFFFFFLGKVLFRFEFHGICRSPSL